VAFIVIVCVLPSWAKESGTAILYLNAPVLVPEEVSFVLGWSLDVVFFKEFSVEFMKY